MNEVTHVSVGDTKLVFRYYIGHEVLQLSEQDFGQDFVVSVEEGNGSIVFRIALVKFRVFFAE